MLERRAHEGVSVGVVGSRNNIAIAIEDLVIISIFGSTAISLSL